MDQTKVDRLLKGESYIAHLPGEWIARCVAEKQFEPTSDMRRLAEADCILICVPTPLSESRDPDLSYVESTARQIAAVLRPGQLIVLESTTYPGTTRDVMLPILEAGGLKAGPGQPRLRADRHRPFGLRLRVHRTARALGGRHAQCDEMRLDRVRSDL